MTADTNECNGASERENVEFEGKGGLNSSPCCDPSNAAGDSHGIASGKDEEIVGESKGDAYSSYVLVGAVDDRVEYDPCNKDPGEDVDKKTMLVENAVMESNAGSQSEQLRVESGELKEEEEENGECGEEKGCDFHESRVLVNGLHVEFDADTTVANDVAEQKLESNGIADENRESEENGECCEEKGCDADDSGVLVNSSHGGLDRDAAVANDDAEQKLESYAVVDENRESEIVDTVAAVASDDAEKELESNVDVGENRESDIMAVEAADSESHQLQNGMEEEPSLVSDVAIEGPTMDPVMEPDVKLESDTCSQDDMRLKIQQSQAVVTEVVESELCLLENGKAELEDGKEEEIANVVSKVPVEGPGRDLNIEPELRSEIVICPMEDVELENVVRNDSNESISSEKQVRNGSDRSADLKALDKAAFVEEGSVEEPKATIASIESSELVGEVRNGSDECAVVEVVDKAAPVEEIAVISGSAEICELATDYRNESLASEEGSTTACDVESIKEDVEISVEGSERTLSGPVNDVRPETEVSNGSLQNTQSESSYAVCSVSESELETPGENTPAENGEHLTTVEVSNTSTEIEVIDDSIGSSENSLSCPVDSVKSEAEVRNGNVESDECLHLSSADDSKSETENENDFAAGEETESEVTKGLGEKSKAIPHDAGDVKLGSEVINDSVEVFENAPSAQSAVDVDTEDQFAGGSEDNKPVAVDAENVEAISRNEALPSPQEDSSAASLDSLKVDAELGKRLPCFIIRIPRYVDNELRAQIDRAQMEVDKKTQHRDSIRAEIRKATHREYRESFEAAKAEERAARNAVQAKRQEMESLQLMLNRMKNATSIEEIDERIHNMQHMIEHETMPLKEEKQLIREIKQLKQVREQLCANMGTQAEIQEAFDQRESIEKRSKLLKQELDSLRNEVSRTEGITKAAKQKHNDEWRNQNELQAKFKEADELRQEAYANLQKLKKQLYEKNKYFRMYLEEKKIALEHASKGNRDALQCHCTNQVERIMELWNKNDEFRNDYVKNNMVSTLSRLKTLDGRSLGPDEKPPVLQNFVEERAHNARVPFAQINAAVAVSMSETMQETSGVPMAAEKTDLKPAIEPGQKNLSVKSKRPAKSSSAETESVTVSSHLGSEKQQKETKQTKEEEEMARQAEELARKERELARKEEELRKEETAAKLREQRRMEDRTKAKEAEERKRRQVEKAQARAQFKAQKEAELKEKEREKKLRKKERKKSSTIADGTTESTGGGADSVPSAENGMPEVTREAEIREKPTATTKRPAKSLPAAKQTKIKPLPMPPRSRGKRKIQTWMWLLAVTVLILALFLAGNTCSLKFSLSRLGF